MNKTKLNNFFFKKKIKSYVLRNSRITKSQNNALKNLWIYFGINYNNKIINFEKIFLNKLPIFIEIGFGMGKSLIKTSNLNIKKNFLGIEVYKPGIGYCLNNIKKKNINNLKIINHDALEVLKNMISNNSISKIQLFFPDPWKKKKHNKRRIFNKKFIKLIHKKLIFKGIFHVITDCKIYAKIILNLINLKKKFLKLNFKNKVYKKLLFNKINTKFENKSIKKKNKLFNFIFIKKK